MVSILRNLVRSCFDKVFYKETEKDSFGKRYLHLYVLFIIVAALSSVNIVTMYIQNKADFDKLPFTINSKLATFYPKNLEIKFVKNELSINQPEPYVLGENLFEDESLSGTSDTQKMSLITIDTNASIDDFDSYKTAALAMKKGIAVKQSDSRGEVRFYSYAEFMKGVTQPYSFDYVSYTQIVNKLRPYINQLPTFAVYAVITICVLFILLGPLFLTSGILINLLFLSVIGYLVASLIKRKHTYGYIYKLGMYSAIPVIVLQQINSVIKVPGVDGIWWLVALLLMVIFIPASEPAQGSLVDSKPSQGSTMDPPKIT